MISHPLMGGQHFTFTRNGQDHELYLPSLLRVYSFRAGGKGPPHVPREARVSSFRQ